VNFAHVYSDLHKSSILIHQTPSPVGVGKTAIAEGLAQRIVAGDVPPGLMGFSLLELDLPSLVRPPDQITGSQLVYKWISFHVKHTTRRIIAHRPWGLA
jgi:hypothetical protein